MKPDLWVLTFAPVSRVREALELFESLGVPENRRVLVTALPEPVRIFPGTILTDHSSDATKWWLVGLEHISSYYPAESDIWDVLVIDTDSRMTAAEVDTVRHHMRVLDCAMAQPDRDGSLGTRRYRVVPADRALPAGATVVAGEFLGDTTFGSLAQVVACDLPTIEVREVVHPATTKMELA